MKLVILLLVATSSVTTLYNSLDPFSLSEQMAFYELYPDTQEGEKALKRSWKLLRTGQGAKLPTFLLPKLDIGSIIALVNRQPYDDPIKLSEDELKLIDNLSSQFANRRLKGSKAWAREEVIALPPHEVDLARGLLIEQFADSDNFRNDILNYEASLDLMALQILARLPEKATDLQKIKEINRYIFQEMQFRFPPHSLYAKDIDLYTFLPSVLDSRQGVCLGVSILYLSLAQRLSLPLEIITPPGHIYVRYHKGDTLINIETTARGVNPPSETYLGINTRKLQERSIKEVIGLAFCNQAAVYWQRGENDTCVHLYEKALPYLDNDHLINMFLGFNYIFTGQKAKGKEMLRPLKNHLFDHAVAPDSLVADYLDGHVSAEGVQALFISVDETRDSIRSKKEELEKLLKKHPKFRGGLLQLAVTHLQLARANDALSVLKKYHKLDPSDPTVAYYLSIVCAERYDFNKSWGYLEEAEAITSARDHKPQALRGLRSKLRSLCPNPSN